ARGSTKQPPQPGSHKEQTSPARRGPLPQSTENSERSSAAAPYPPPPARSFQPLLTRRTSNSEIDSIGIFLRSCGRIRQANSQVKARNKQHHTSSPGGVAYDSPGGKSWVSSKKGNRVP